MKTFKSILEFQRHFNTEEKCIEFLEEQRWNGTPVCPHCGSTNVCRFTTGKLFKCRIPECRKKFTVTVGTIYQSSKLPLTTWFVATYILTVHSKGISSLQLASFLGITQKSAWHVAHRVRQMLTEKDPEALANMVEADECYIGGLNKNRHASKKKKNAAGCHPDKTIVFGVVERGGKLRTEIIEKVNQETIKGVLAKHVKEGATVYHDEAGAYTYINDKYISDKVMHSRGEYVRGEVHTNTIEGYWNILRKQIDGIHHSVSPKHLHRYCNESAFRYNERGLGQDAKFALALTQCNGGLKYRDLINKG